MTDPEARDDHATILDMANTILEARAGQIGTHYETCWMNHVGCFAAYVRLALTKEEEV